MNNSNSSARNEKESIHTNSTPMVIKQLKDNQQKGYVNNVANVNLLAYLQQGSAENSQSEVSMSESSTQKALNSGTPHRRASSDAPPEASLLPSPGDFIRSSKSPPVTDQKVQEKLSSESIANARSKIAQNVQAIKREMSGVQPDPVDLQQIHQSQAGSKQDQNSEETPQSVGGKNDKIPSLFAEPITRQTRPSLMGNRNQPPDQDSYSYERSNYQCQRPQKISYGLQAQEFDGGNIRGGLVMI